MSFVTTRTIVCLQNPTNIPNGKTARESSGKTPVDSLGSNGLAFVLRRVKNT